MISIYLLSLFLGLTGDYINMTPVSQTQEVFRSVEIGLAELSPNGYDGGLAVPASGCASGPCVPRIEQSCAADSTVRVSIYDMQYSVTGVMRPSVADAKLIFLGHTYYYGTGMVDTVSYNTSNWTNVFHFNLTPNTDYAGEYYDTYRVGANCNPRYGGCTKHAHTYPFSFTTISCGPVPSAELLVRNITENGSFASAIDSIASDDQIALSWNSDNTTSCIGSNFSTGTGAPTDGIQEDVNEPTRGTSRTYSVICEGTNGTASDSVTVEVVAFSEPELSVMPAFVYIGETAELNWILKGNDPASCTLSGPNLPNGFSLSTQTGSVEVPVQGRTQYVLTCPGGTDSGTVQVLPVFQET